MSEADGLFPDRVISFESRTEPSIAGSRAAAEKLVPWEIAVTTPIAV
ncbi:MAG: hypothetical protein VKK80_09300 [Prochlorothrix sp.]|nr:hypothetical protein [Prochlorothrix sp.]